MHRFVYATGGHLPFPRLQCSQYDSGSHAAKTYTVLSRNDPSPDGDHLSATSVSGTPALAGRELSVMGVVPQRDLNTHIHPGLKPAPMLRRDRMLVPTQNCDVSSLPEQTTVSGLHVTPP